MEEALGIDINKDGRIGGPGPMATVERATHIDLNGDGIIGGYRPPASGGYLTLYYPTTFIFISFLV